MSHVMRTPLNAVLGFAAAAEGSMAVVDALLAGGMAQNARVCAEALCLASTNAERDMVQVMLARGVEKVGVTHCSGMQAIAAFSRGFGRNFVPLGVGRVLTFAAPR